MMHAKIISELSGARGLIQNSPLRGRVCLVTGELAGPDHNGGIGTTNRALALTLRNCGFEVDILYTRVDGGQPFSVRGSFAQHVNAFRNFGLQLRCIDHPGVWNDWQAKSYFVLQHLLRRQYDLAFFDDTHGNAYYPLLARRTGNIELRGTVMCVTAHSATQWISDLNHTPVSTIEEIRLMEMERRCIELADAVKAPSEYILRKYRDYGWSIPANSIVLPNFLPGSRSKKRAHKAAAVDELVFFGRLETRKGLSLFCRALDRLKYKLHDKTVTFLGKATTENGVSTVESLVRYAGAWPFKVRLINNFDQEQALAYLKRPGRLAVVASPEDNSPSAVLECLTEGIPFIACSGSGGEELLDEKSRAANLFAPSVDSLCAKLVQLFEFGATPGRPAFDDRELHEKFAAWIDGLIALAQQAPAARRDALRKPTLVVIVPPEIDAREATAEVVRAAATFDGLVDIELLSTDVPALRFELTNAAPAAPVNVSDFSEFARVALSLATREPHVVALCHVTQIPSSIWIKRAQNCFTSEEEICALTGMVAAAEQRRIRTRDPFFSSDDDAPVISRYLMGNASALFPVVQETNGGFVVLRSEVLALIADVAPPVDRQHDRLKQMAHWIDEIVISLHLAGKRFELVPDLAAPHEVREALFERFQLGQFMRPLASKIFGYTAGSDQQLLAQLAIDIGLTRERALANREYLRRMFERFGPRTIETNISVLDPEHARQLATLAHANGQIELATDLSAKAGTKDHASKEVTFDEFVKKEADAVSLIAETSARNFRGLNLDYDFSFRFDQAALEIRLHANSVDKGMAAIVYSAIDLSEVDCFTCLNRVQDGANPIRFRLELLTANARLRWSSEKIVYGGEESPWSLELPADIRGKCRVLIGIEMADPDTSSTGAFATWINPRFVRHV